MPQNEGISQTEMYNVCMCIHSPFSEEFESLGAISLAL